MKDDIMSISEQEKAQLFQCERRMAIMIAAKQLQAPKVPIMGIISVSKQEEAWLIQRTRGKAT